MTFLWPGHMAMSNEEFPSYRTWLGEGQERGPSGSREGNNWLNFINCVRSRKPEEQNAPIEEGVISCALIHLANTSYRLGRTLNFDPIKQEVIGDEEANLMLRGTYSQQPHVLFLTRTNLYSFLDEGHRSVPTMLFLLQFPLSDAYQFHAEHFFDVWSTSSAEVRREKWDHDCLVLFEWLGGPTVFRTAEGVVQGCCIELTSSATPGRHMVVPNFRFSHSAK